MDVDVLAISADDAAASRQTCELMGHCLRILSDPQATVIQELGLAETDEQVAHLIARPAVFVVDRHGIVRYRYVSRSASDRPTTALLTLAAESLSRLDRTEGDTP